MDELTDKEAINRLRDDQKLCNKHSGVFQLFAFFTYCDGAAFDICLLQFWSAEEVQCQQPSVEVIEGTELLLPCGVAYHFSQMPSSEMTPVLSWSIGANQNNSIQTPISNSSYVE